MIGFQDGEILDMHQTVKLLPPLVKPYSFLRSTPRSNDSFAPVDERKSGSWGWSSIGGTQEGINVKGPRAVYVAFWNFVKRVCQPWNEPGSG